MRSRDAAWWGIVKLAVYEVVTVALVTPWSSARCCALRIACHCVSVGFVGLPMVVQALYGLLWVSSTRKWVTKTSLPASAAGRLLTVTVTLSVPVLLSV